MNTLDNYKQAVFTLALEFEKHKDPEFEYESADWTTYTGHFPWDDYGIYCDTSEFYSWSTNDMYLILKENIPYNIACEHQDITVNEMWNDLPHYNLDFYWRVRKEKMDMNFEDFFMFLQNDYHLSRAKIYTKEYKEQTDRLMQKLKDDYLINVKI